MRLWKRFIGDWWVVRPCGWPYPQGYATFNHYRRMVADTGLTKEHAQAICDSMNRRQT